MFRYLKYAFVFSTCVLTSCSSIYGSHGVIQNRSNDYLNANNIAPLKIPPGLSSSTIEAHYPVSDRNYPDQQKKVKLIPPNLTSAKPDEKATVTSSTLSPAHISHMSEPTTQPIAQRRAISASQTAQLGTTGFAVQTSETPQSKPSGLTTLNIKASHSDPKRFAKRNQTSKPNAKGFAVKNTETPNPVTQSFTASTPEPQALSSSQQKQAEAHYYDPHTRSTTGGVGKPIAAIFNKIWPWGKKAPAQNTGNDSQPTDPALFGQPNANTAQTRSPRPLAPVQSSDARSAAPQSVSHNVVGKPLSSIAETILPQDKATNSATQSTAAQPGSQTTAQSTAVQPGSQTTAQSTAAQPGSQTTAQSTADQLTAQKNKHLVANDPSHSTEQKSKMPSMYFDRFTRR